MRATDLPDDAVAAFRKLHRQLQETPLKQVPTNFLRRSTRPKSQAAGP